MESCLCHCLLCAKELSISDEAPSSKFLWKQLEACWELDTRLGDLRKVELMVLTALDWRTHDLTAASVLDTLVCLLGYQQNSVFQTGCYEQMHVVRESCRLLLAKALRGGFWNWICTHNGVGHGQQHLACSNWFTWIWWASDSRFETARPFFTLPFTLPADPRFIHFRPSSLATAAVLLLLDTINDLRTDLASFRLALLELYSPLHSQEVSSLDAGLRLTFGRRWGSPSVCDSSRVFTAF